MKKNIVLITNLSFIFGALLLLAGLAQEYTAVHDLNVQRIVAEGSRVKAVVVEKKVVKKEYKGTFSHPKELVENRIYVKIMDSPYEGKILWDLAPQQIYERVTVGQEVHAFVRKDDIFIEELRPETPSKSPLYIIAGIILITVGLTAKGVLRSEDQETMN